MASKATLAKLHTKQLSYTPIPQPYYTYKNGTWQPSTATERNQLQPFTSLHVFTWNIDFQSSYSQHRMHAALSYLSTLISIIPPSSPIIIFLQEMCEDHPEALKFGARLDSHDISILMEISWVQEQFYLSDVDGSNWAEGYGTVGLIDKRLCVAEVSRLKFISEYGRDALFVDIPFSTPNSIGDGVEEKKSNLRLCTVHLDSAGGSLRPIQWSALQSQLQDTSSNIAASILTGDMNANQPRDRTAPQYHGFRDAYIDLGGIEGAEEGMTWGLQSAGGEKRRNTGRFDKVCYWNQGESSRSEGILRVKQLERIGIGVRVEDEEVREALEELEETSFVTDHFGLVSKFEIVHGGLKGIAAKS